MRPSSFTDILLVLLQEALSDEMKCKTSMSAVGAGMRLRTGVVEVEFVKSIAEMQTFALSSFFLGDERAAMSAEISVRWPSKVSADV